MANTDHGYFVYADGPIGGVDGSGDTFIVKVQRFQNAVDDALFVFTGGASVGLPDPGSNGILVRDSVGHTIVRTLIGTVNQITVTNGSGVSGNPTISVPSNAQLSIAKLTNLTSNGLVKTSGGDGSLSIDTSTYATQAYADALVVGLANAALSNLSSVAINTDLLLGTSDGGALGSTSKMWSDLFLASGAVVNFNNGDVTLTHAANLLTFAGATNGYKFDTCLGIGTTPSYPFHLVDSLSGLQYSALIDTTQTNNDSLRSYTLRIQSVMNGAGTGAATNYGIYSQLTSGASGNAGNLTGIRGVAGANNAGRIQQAVGVGAGVFVNYGGTSNFDPVSSFSAIGIDVDTFETAGGGTVNLNGGFVAGIRILKPFDSGGSTVNGTYLAGLYMEDFNASYGTYSGGKWGLYIAGGNNFIGGNTTLFSSDPGFASDRGAFFMGNASSAPASAYSGGATLYAASNRLVSLSDVFINKPTASLFLKDTATGWQVSSSTIINPQANNSIRSSSFTSGLSGWGINAIGDAEFNNVTTRGEIRASVFKVNEIAATAGTFGVFYSASTLNADGTTPGANGSDFLIDVKNSDAGGMLFAVGDVIRLKTLVSTSGTVIGDAWATVASRTNHTTYATYTVTLRSGSTTTTFKAGTAVADYGPSGAGFITLSADGTVGNSPNLTMGSHAGSPWLGITTLLRLGNLNGSYGYATDVYGFATGQYGTANQPSILVDTTNGIRIIGGASGTTQLGQWDTSGNIIVGQTGSGKSNTYISAGDFKIRLNTTSLFNVDTSGNVRVGTDTSAPSTTNLFVSNASQTYNSEAGFIAGDILIGDNTSASNYGNIKITGGGIKFRRGVTDYITINSTDAQFTNLIKMSGSTAAIALGATPPTSASVGTGIWVDRTGIYGLNASTLQSKIDANGLFSGTIINLSGGINLNDAGTGVAFKVGSSTVGSIIADSIGGSLTDLSIQGVAISSAASYNFVLNFVGGDGTRNTNARFVASNSVSRIAFYGHDDAGGSVPLQGVVIGSNVAPNAMLDVRGDIFSTGSLGATGSRLVKGWFTDLQVTNAIAGSVTGNAATVTTNANLTGPITSSGNATSIGSQTGTGSVFAMQAGPSFTGVVSSSGSIQITGAGASAAASKFALGESGGTAVITSYGPDNSTPGTILFGALSANGSVGDFYITLNSDGGTTFGSPTGGSKGAGTINAKAVYDDNVLLTDWVFDLYYDGRVRNDDKFYHGQSLFTLESTRDCTGGERRLPWMPTRNTFEKERSLGGMVSRLWQGQEQQQLYILELEAWVKNLQRDLDKFRN